MPIELQENAVRAKRIEDTIDQLLPESNFYFFKIFNDDIEVNRQKNKIEEEHILKLIKKIRETNSFYVKQG